MEISTLTLLFIFGLIIGSFLNAISFRYKVGDRIFFTRSIQGRSHCMNCENTLRWYELIPLLSFFIQGFKCRHCEHSLSWQYPGIEFLTGFLTAALPTFFFTQFNVQSYLSQGESITWFILFVVVWLLATYTFITISVIDFRHRILPDQGNLLLTVLGILILFIKSSYPAQFINQGSFFGSYRIVFFADNLLIINTLIAVTAAIILFGGIILLTRGKGMGVGDLKLAVPIALLLSWPDVILSFMGAFVVGAFFGLILLVSKVKKINQAVPFGPFIALGVYITIFYGEPLLRWYFQLV